MTRNEILCIPVPRDTCTTRIGRAVHVVEAPFHEAGGFEFDSRVRSLENFQVAFLFVLS